jgi:hypothetical protein
MGRVFNGGQDVIGFKVGVVRQYFRMRSSGAQKLENIGDPHPHSTNAGTTAAFTGFESDTFQQFDIHIYNHKADPG